MQMGKTPSPADPRVVSLLASAVTLDRRAIEEAVEGFIALLDMSDPDPDLEDGEHSSPHIDACGREIHSRTLADIKPGGDPDGDDRAWQEWDARDPAARRRARHEPIGTFTSNEDDEDDDAQEDDDPREAEPDQEQVTWPEYPDRQPDNLAHPEALDDQEPDGQDIRNLYRDRIRATRCRATPRGYNPYQLLGRTAWHVNTGATA